MQKGHIRKEIYSIEEVLSKAVSPDIEDEKSRVDYHGDMIRMNSDRYNVFKLKGLKCVSCGIKGEYFAKERNYKARTYHFNLYATNKHGEEVLLTKDHIIPKSKGGQNHISNYQTMCGICNEAKKDTIEV